MLRLLALPIVAWIAFMAIVWLFQRRLIYLPTNDPMPDLSLVLPRAEEVSIPTEDGLRLAASLVPAETPQSAGTVLLFHGNGGDRAMRWPLVRALSRRGFDVLSLDYRGYGGNLGSPSERGLASDARAAWTWIAGRSGVDPSRIVYFGESLGCAVAVALAVDHPPAALVLRSPFTSLADVGRIHYPYLPVRLLLSDRYPSIDRIPRIGSPLLVIAGERDTIIPAAMSRTLFEAARDPKRYVLIPGADHNDEQMLVGEQLLAEIFRFLEETLDPAGRKRETGPEGEARPARESAPESTGARLREGPGPRG